MVRPATLLLLWLAAAAAAAAEPAAPAAPGPGLRGAASPATVSSSPGAGNASLGSGAYSSKLAACEDGRASAATNPNAAFVCAEEISGAWEPIVMSIHSDYVYCSELGGNFESCDDCYSKANACSEGMKEQKDHEGQKLCEQVSQSCWSYFWIPGGVQNICDGDECQQ